MIRIMVNILAVMAILFGYMCIFFGTLYVLKIACLELFGIDVTDKRYRK